LSGRAVPDLRVLAYSDSGIFSGAEAVMRDVIRGLTESPRYDVSCAAPRENSDLWEAFAEAAGRPPLHVPAQPLRLAAIHLFDPRRARRAARVVAQARPDVLLANLPSAEYGGTPLRLRRRPPAVGLLHVVGSPRRLGFRLGRLREALARRVLRRLEAVCVITESAAREYEEVWQAGRTRVRAMRLPRPRVTAADSGDARRLLGLPPGPLVGIAGRISFKQKGHDTFVAAAAELCARRPDVVFAVAGTGRDDARLRRSIADRGLSDRFHLLGHVEPISRFLSAVDVIALPSRFEGLPVVALEALEADVPGVAASSDGLRDVWPPDWQIPPGDSGALADALDRLLDAPEGDVRAGIAEGRERARSYATADVAADVAGVIDEVTRVS
jgi:glycosyltransferase involved in cell wall biosynthesis